MDVDVGPVVGTAVLWKERENTIPEDNEDGYSGQAGLWYGGAFRPSSSKVVRFMNSTIKTSLIKF